MGEQQMETGILRLAKEVRHSLHGIMGFLELAAEDPLSVRQASFLSHSRNSADQLLGVAADLCELSRPELPPHQSCMFQPASAVAEVAELAAPLAKRKGLRLDWGFTPASQEQVHGPRDLIQDTIRRVVDNAVRFTQAGDVRVSADVCAAGDTARLVVEVGDTGSGLPEDFRVFVQSKDTGNLPDQGLGLAIVRRRMSLMHGGLSVVSSASAGTILRLSIPVQPVQAEIGEEDPEQPKDRGEHLPRLLVAEDSEDDFFVFQGYVGEGHKLTRAVDGAEAIRLAKTGNYDLIVMDATMPLVDGYSATRAIREWESNTGRSQRIPILLFSADDPAKQAKLGGAAGCSGYLAKPASKDEVLRALNFFAMAGASAQR